MHFSNRHNVLPVLLFLLATGHCFDVSAENLALRMDSKKEKLSVFRDGGQAPIITQNARLDFRPYLHPIVAPDGKGVLTEYSPGHHRHQTGLYWGFTRVNGRDYFHHPEGSYWKRKSVEILKGQGRQVSWQTVYELLGGDGKAVLSENQTWTMSASGSEYFLDLAWQGTALTDVTIGKYNYGGLFLRMPWKRGISGDVVNSEGQVNGQGEGQRAVWVDAGMQIEGRTDHGHIAILDHPGNKDFPLPWRIDGQLGIGPVRARLGDWTIKKGETATINHQVVVYTGKRDAEHVDELWRKYSRHAEKPLIGEAARLNLLVDTIGKSKDSSVQTALLRGMLDGLAGRRNVAPPANWAVVKIKLANSQDGDVRSLTQNLSQLFGDEAAASQSLKTVADSTKPASVRRTALRSLLEQQNQAASDLLESLLDDPDLAIDAIRGYAAVENATAPSVLLSRFEQMTSKQKRAVVETLAARKRYATRLLEELQHGKVSKKDIPAHVARSLSTLLGDRFTSFFGKIKAVTVDREKQIARYKKLLTEDAIAKGDASRGRAVFKKTCASCHLLYGDGAKIGPDLTGSNRANLDYILLNSVAPSYDVPDAYKLTTVVTVDGRNINGILAEEDGSRIILKTVEQPRVVITKQDIDIRKVSPNSMMPDGQFDKMKPQEIIDLIKYLRTTAQVELPK